MTHNQSGRNSIQATSDTHKELYKLLQCIHHLEKTEKNNPLPKAFIKKQKELKRFIKPAQISNSFSKNYETVVTKFITESVNVLNNHYEARISETLGYLRSQRISSAILQVGSQIALRWARRNFGKKLTQRTVNKFHQIARTIAPIPDRSAPSSPIPDFGTSRSPLDDAPLVDEDPHSTSTPFKPHTSPNAITSENPNASHTDSHSHLDTSRASYSSVVRGATTNNSPSTPQQERTPTRPNQTDNPHSTQPSPHSNASSPSNSQTPNSQNTVNVQGYTDPLSTFFPFPFKYKQNIFISAEHAYQHDKARYYEDFTAMARISQAPTAGEARKIGNELNRKHQYRTEGYEWDIKKRYVMEDLLYAKSQQCEQFRKALLGTGDKQITHNVPDKFWGSTHVNKGKTMEGRNKYAQVLAQTRSKLVLEQQHAKANKPKQGLLPTPPPNSRIPTPVTTSNRFSLLGEGTSRDADEITAIPTASPTDSPNSPDTQPSKRRRIGSSPTANQSEHVVGPSMTVHRDRARWKLPPLKTQVVVIGDSNINRATDLETKVRSIEFHSFPGAKLVHLKNLLSPPPPHSLPPQDTPKAVILSIGMNNRTDRRPSFEPQIKTVIQNASKLFPNATIYIPLINIPPEIPPHQQTNLNKFNQLILTLSERLQTFKTLPKELQTFKTLPKLPQQNFKIDPRDTAYKIHWSTETANSILAHWTSNLN